YRSNTPYSFLFGHGASLSGLLSLYSPSGCSNYPTEIDVIDADGAHYAFFIGSDQRTYTHTATPSRFYGAKVYTMPSIAYYGESIVLTLPDGSTYTFGSVCPNALKSLTRSDGTGLSYYYTAGLLTKIVSNSGRYVTLTYNSNNFVSQVTDNTGRG